MFCPECGAELTKDMSFCPECGTMRPTPDPDPDSKHAPAPSPVPALDPVPAPVSGPGPNPGLAPNLVFKKLPLAIAAIVVAAVLIVVGIAVMKTKPELSVDDIKSDIPSVRQAEKSTWGDTDDLNYVSATIDSTNDWDSSGVSYRDATVTAVYENSGQRMTVVYNLTYMYYDGAWGLKRAGDTSSSTEPIAGVSDEKLSSAAQTIMAKVDSGHPYKDASGKTQKLQSLYTDNFSCSVAKNEFNDDDETCSVNLDIASSVGVKSYKGTVEVDFSWQDNGWEISDCSAADSSYVPSYNNLIGTWTGTLTEAKGTTFNCYAGRENPVILTVKSVDVNSSTAVVDLSYTWHDHAKWAFTSDMNSYEGDTRVSKTDLVIDIKVGSSDYKIYDPDTGSAVSLRIDKDGTVKMWVDTGLSWSSGSLITRENQTDTYTMAKSSDAVA